MFRRFMIVCWALWALLGAVSLASFAVYHSSGEEMREFKLGFRDEDVDPDIVRMDIAKFLLALDARKVEKFGVYADVPYEGESDAAWAMRSQIQKEAFRIASTIDNGNSSEIIVDSNINDEDLLGTLDETSVAMLELQRLTERRRSLYGAVIFTGFVSTILLIWNIVWHVGHWIWMGKDTE